MGFFDWLNKAAVRAEVHELVESIVKSTKRGEIVWERRGPSDYDYDSGFKCRDQVSGIALEFYRDRREGAVDDTWLLETRDRHGEVTGVVELTEFQYALLVMEAVGSAQSHGSLRRSVDSETHRGPFL